MFKIFHNLFGVEVTASQFQVKGRHKSSVFDRSTTKGLIPASGQITRQAVPWLPAPPLRLSGLPTGATTWPSSLAHANRRGNLVCPT